MKPANRRSLRTPLIERVVSTCSQDRIKLFAIPSLEAAQNDIERMLDGFKLHSTRRYYRQRYWEKESQEAIFANRIEPDLKLESVAEHSWHVADAALLLAQHFQTLSLERCLSLAILHDKLEMITGDFDPVGKSGTGEETHAFSQLKQNQKQEVEFTALKAYLSGLSGKGRDYQERIIMEFIERKTDEALFVNALDKLQALCFVTQKKGGDMEDEHIYFTVRYSRKCVTYFPSLVNHYKVTLDLLLNKVSSFRQINRRELELELFRQFEFEF